ncbi:MAG: FKBP-type peptidyl-prolyl cis-trans isomerase [Bacteroidaceae bacterium]|nr:FKBP-type peptidyl-prolyl cis-trans isomerase [Bacteroidaceae bacterium]
MDKLSYSFGLAIGSQLVDLGAETIQVDDFAQALKDVFEGRQLAVDPGEAQHLVNEFIQKQQDAKRAEAESKGQQAKAEGEAFLKKNAGLENVVVLPSGLQYEVLQEGNGRSPKATDQVKCHYEGRLIDGTVFDSSIRRGQPAVFPLNGVISGWTEGLQLMKEGAKYRFYIPYQLAYGANGAGGSIPPYAALIFDVELLEVL